jgi:hypothetical protein
VLFLIAGIVVTAAFGHESADGNRESTLGSVLFAVGLVGLLAVGIRTLYWKCRNQFERLRNWWTGNG